MVELLILGFHKSLFIVSFALVLVGLLNGHLIRKNTFACLFSAHDIISLSHHEQVYLSILVHDVIKLLY